MSDLLEVPKINYTSIGTMVYNCCDILFRICFFLMLNQFKILLISAVILRHIFTALPIKYSSIPGASIYPMTTGLFIVYFLYRSVSELGF